MFSRLKRWWRNSWIRTTYEDRLVWVQKVMEEVENIANSPEVKSGFPEAVERAEYLLSRYVVAMPAINEFEELVLDNFTDSRVEHLAPLLIFPALKSDAGISPIAAYLREHAQSASYSPEGHMVILGMDEKETLRYMGTTVLHEAGHAIAAENEGRVLIPQVSRNKRLRLEEELRMWHFDCRLAGFLGGEELRHQVECTAKKIIDGWMNGHLFQMKVGSDTPLDLCYGPIKEPSRLGARTVLYMRYCELIALHMLHGPVAAYEHQLDLIARICENNYKKEEEFIQNQKK